MKLKKYNQKFKALSLSFLLVLGISCSENNEEIIDLNDSEQLLTAAKTSNLALGRETTQSSTDYNGEASRAVDGDTNGKWNGGSVTHTNSEYQAYWQVYLDEETAIEEVIIWNRTNSCCADRLNNFDVFVYDDDSTLTFKTTIDALSDDSISIDVGGAIGSRVRIKLKDTGVLSLAEVQVYGEEEEEGSSEDINSVVWENWYLSVPINDGDGATSIYYEDIEALNLSTEEKVYFNQNSDGSYKMFTKFTGYTTSGEKDLDSGSYCRTELREYYRGNQSTSDNWSMNSGTHIMESTLKVSSIGGDGRTYVGQIHGYKTGSLTNSPATVKVQWNNGDIRLEYYTAEGKDDDGEWTSTDDVAVTVAEVENEKFTIKIKIEDGKLYLAVVCDAKGVNTGYVEYYDYDANGYVYDNYFKTGNYFKWNDDYTETSEVILYGVSTSHE